MIGRSRSARFYFLTTVVSEALACLVVVALAAIVVSLAFAAIVVSEALVFLVTAVDLILMRVQVRLPFSVLHTSFVLAFVVAEDAEPTPRDTVMSSAAPAADRRMVDRLEVTHGKVRGELLRRGLPSQCSHRGSQQALRRMAAGPSSR